MINILYLFFTLPIGGAEEHLRTILKYLPKDLYNPTVCCMGNKDIIGEEIEKSGINVIELKEKHRVFNFSLLKSLENIIHKNNIHIIHSHLYHANMYGRFAAIRTGIPVVASEHATTGKMSLRRKLINRWLSGKTSTVIAVSNPVKQYVMERDHLPENRIQVVHNGIDIDGALSGLTKRQAREKLNIPDDCFTIGLTGRLIERKGHKVLLQAAQKLLGVISSFRILIAGEGELDGTLRELSSKLGIDGQVEFMGARRDVPDILRALDVFAFPSLPGEGLSIALLEAMAAGLPIIATPSGGTAEIIRNGVNGIAVPYNDPTALAEALAKLCFDKPLAEFLGKNAEDTVRREYGAPAMIDKFHLIYQKALAG